MLPGVDISPCNVFRCHPRVENLSLWRPDVNNWDPREVGGLLEIEQDRPASRRSPDLWESLRRSHTEFLPLAILALSAPPPLKRTE